MARLFINGNSGECVLVANTAKTILQIKAAANQRAVLKMLKIFGKQAAGGTDVPVKVRLTRSTANFGTGTGITFGKANPSDPETIQTTGSSNFTVEPTSPSDDGLWYEVNPQSGLIEFFPPLLEEEIPGGAALNVEVTSTGTPTVLCTVKVEE